MTNEPKVGDTIILSGFKGRRTFWDWLLRRPARTLPPVTAVVTSATRTTIRL